MVSSDLQKEKIETLVIPVVADKEVHEDNIISSLVKMAKGFREFQGEKDEELVLHHVPDIRCERILFFGIGNIEAVEPESMRNFAGKAIAKCIKNRFGRPVIAVPSEKKVGIEISSLLAALMEGAYLGNHIFDRYKKEKKQKPVDEIRFMVPTSIQKGFKELPVRVRSICKGTVFARDWVSTPPNDKTPELFAKSIIDRAKKARLKVVVLDENELKRKKFGAVLAVAAGSRSKPRMVLMEYVSEGASKTIALVGKGVTFDSGGINLKSSDSIEDMKMDMSGAAAVAATLITATEIKPMVNLVGVIPIVENMPSGGATRPGDIIRTYDGRTVEIGNTDAEGRLILVDAITLAIERYKPHCLIDMATLTGACVVALGEKIAGVFSPDDALAAQIVRSGEKTFERCWRMPLPEDYKELLKSDFADIKNISGTRWAGAITAALFLKDFVTKDVRWAHIDIAGPAYLKKDSAYCRAGGTGFGVRLLWDVIEHL